MDGAAHGHCRLFPVSGRRGGTLAGPKLFRALFSGHLYYGPVYDAAAYQPVVDHWAYLLDVTASAESKNRFNLINMYDRARFTYGFYQLAAHTPRDNLILLFREALLGADFQNLFPELKLVGGKVFRVAADGTDTDLEAESSIRPRASISCETSWRI